MNTHIDWDKYKYVDYLNVKNKEIEKLPSGLSISTMCATSKLNTKINIVNIEKYLQLNSNDILAIEKDSTKALITKNKYKKKKKEDLIPKKTTYFYNQITVDIRSTCGDTNNLDKEPRINIKIFKNGTIQMAGCKTINDTNIVLNKLICRLSEIKAIIENDVIVEKKFIENYNTITITDFNIYMINTNYTLSILIDREKLYKLLLLKKIKAIYEPCIRACVIIKYTPLENNLEEKEVSIFIFQEGNIIITGARSISHILSAYYYTNNILTTHKDDILKKEEKQEGETTIKLYNDIMKEVNLGLIKI
jgi:TATA-box binding protein (TBP) (component of TFIID and TFIIIB)